MVTKDKAVALLCFTHSRLAHLGAGEPKSEITCEKAKIVYEQLAKIRDHLKDNSMSVESINQLQDSFYAGMITYYYNVARKVLNKEIPKGDDIIEDVIALSILDYLQCEKGIDILTNINPTELISQFENAGMHRKEVSKMITVGSKIVEAVENSNYTRYLKQNRKRK